MKNSKPYKIKTVFTFTTFIFIILFGITIVYLVNSYMKEQALIEAESKARIITDLSLSIHTYFSHNLKPAVFKISDKTSSNQYFDPVWMSSTYAVREIKKYFSGINENGYYYKECAINARSPENEADEYEKEFIAELNSSGIESRTAVRVINDSTYLDILRRGEVMEKSCLRCHSTPENAPQEMVNHYGSEKSFNRTDGEVISAISIRIPLEEAYGDANRLSMMLSGIIVFIVLIYAAGTVEINRRLIFSPLKKLQRRATNILNNREKLSEIVEPEGSLEIRNLTGAFNAMSIELSSFMSDLEKKLEERTSEIVSANRELEKSIQEKDLLLKEVHHRIKNNMSMIGGLLMLQAETVDNESAAASLIDAQGRIANMMLLYDKLYKNAAYGDIMTADYIPDLIDDIRSTFSGTNSITLHKKIENFEIHARTLFPISLIINELITNSFKYAFPDKRDGIITVQINREEENSIEIRVEDNGIGLPPDFSITDPKTFGLYLVTALAEQSGGYAELRIGDGACFLIRLHL